MQYNRKLYIFIHKMLVAKVENKILKNLIN